MYPLLMELTKPIQYVGVVHIQIVYEIWLLEQWLVWYPYHVMGSLPSVSTETSFLQATIFSGIFPPII